MLAPTCGVTQVNLPRSDTCPSLPRSLGQFELTIIFGVPKVPAWSSALKARVHTSLERFARGVWAEVGIRKRDGSSQPADTRMSELPTSLIPNFRDVAQRMGAGLNAQPRSESVLEWDRNLPGVPIPNGGEQSDYVAEQSVPVLERTAPPEYAAGGPPFEGWHLLTEEELSDSKEDRKSGPQSKQAPSHGGTSGLESVQYNALADSGHQGTEILLNRLVRHSTRHHFEERSENQAFSSGSAYLEGTALVQETVQSAEWKDQSTAGALSEGEKGKNIALLQKVQPAEHVGNSGGEDRITAGLNGIDGRERTDKTDRNDGTDRTSRADRRDSGISVASKELSVEHYYDSGDPRPTWQVLPLKAQPLPLSEKIEVGPLWKRDFYDASYEYIRTASHEMSTRLLGKRPSGKGSDSEHEVGESFEAVDSGDSAHIPAELTSLAEVEFTKREVERVKKALILKDASRNREDPPETFRSSSESDNEFEEDGLWPDFTTGSQDVSTEHWAYPPSVRQMERNQQLTKGFLESSVIIPEAPEPEAGNGTLQNEGRNGHLRQEGTKEAGGRLQITEQHRTGE
jgi:hypothetical protein